MGERRVSKIIHQTWKDRDIPSKFKTYQNSWRSALFDWEYRLWTDEDNRNFISTHYPFFIKTYDAYPQEIMRVDAVRYFWMYHYGGLYVDLDFELLKPLEHLFEGKSIVIGLEPPQHSERSIVKNNNLDNVICNALMYSRSKMPFWKFVIGELEKCRNESHALLATGPIFLTRCYLKYAKKEELSILPSSYFYPLVQGEKPQKGTEASYAVHHWEGSWWRNKMEKKNFLDKLVNFMKR